MCALLVVRVDGIFSRAVMATSTATTAAATNPREKPAKTPAGPGEVAGGGGDGGQYGDAEGCADFVAGHEESGCHSGVLRRNALHRGLRDGDGDHADP